MPARKSALTREVYRIYDKYVKPFEHEHEGEYALVTPDGDVHFAPSVLEIMDKAHTIPNEKNQIFKVGDVFVYRV